MASNPDPPPPPKYSAELSLLTPLSPRRTTHLAVDPAGNTYFVQESDNGDDVTFIAGPSDVSRATALSSANILAAATDSSVAAAGDKGNIQSITAGPGGEIYFYFLGGGKRNTVACFGRYLLRTGAMQILASTDALEKATSLGRSIELARGTVACSGRTVYLLVRNSDIAAMFCFDTRQLPNDGQMALGKPITDLRTTEGALPLTRPDIDIAPGSDGSTLLSDPWSGAIWNATPDGNASLICSIVGVSKALSLPAAGKDGMITMLAGEGEPIPPHVKERIDAVSVELRYPTLLLTKSGKLTAVSRDDLRAPASFHLYAIALQQLVYDPAHDNYIGFDSASGQIMRVKIQNKG